MTLKIKSTTGFVGDILRKNILPFIHELILLSLIFLGGIGAGKLIPIPSTLISMAIFLLCLILKVLKTDHFKRITPLLLSHLALFFIPPAVMILDSYELFAKDAWKIVILLILSNIAVMGVTGFVVQYFLNERRVSNDK